MEKKRVFFITLRGEKSETIQCRFPAVYYSFLIFRYLLHLKIILFSGLRPESTYFLDAARPAKTYFLATAAEKFYTTLGHKQRMTQIAVYRPRLRLGR